MKCTCNAYTLENYGCSCGADNPQTGLDALLDMKSKSETYDKIIKFALEYFEATYDTVMISGKPSLREHNAFEALGKVFRESGIKVQLVPEHKRKKE